LQLKQWLTPLHRTAINDQSSILNSTDKSQYHSPTLDAIDETTAKTIELSSSDREYIRNMQLLLDARDLNKTGNMIRVVDLINGLRTRVYIVQTSPRFNISDLEKQVKNIERSLGIKQINVIPSIEGKPGLSHIEVPNSCKVDIIYLRDVLKTAEFQAQAKTAIPLGQDIYGNTVYKELSKFPHIAISGTTGSGKSVQVNAMIISLMARHQPAELQFIMIDPKMLELSIYQDSPYLSLPIITHMKDAKGTLERLVNEMEYRYALLSTLKVRNIESYNNQLNTRRINSLLGTKIAEKLLHPATKKCQKLPLIVCVIDEMADLMMQYGKEVEVLIARIAQKARAAGIHLILATQRPDKEVMTGLIKANIPSRIALSVDSALNSRIILDQKGAEKLLGKGDMLIKTAEDAEILRAQGYFIDASEITQFLGEVA
jgi:S-DNA-T family DNA segregation ATPase FtsK/SpoIIIE